MSEKQIGKENYKTHKFFEFTLKADNRNQAEEEAQEMLKVIQGPLTETYKLYITLNLIPGDENNMDNFYTYLCQVFAQSIRSESMTHKHMRTKEVRELDIFGLGFRAGLDYFIVER